jgi:hypothetical protein
VHDPPRNPHGAWRAHRACARVVPEMWVDEVVRPDGGREGVVFGVDGIVKDPWALVGRLPRVGELRIADARAQKCTLCKKAKAYDAPIQCTKGKCPKAFHVACAHEHDGVVFTVVRETAKEMLLTEPGLPTPLPAAPAPAPVPELLAIDALLAYPMDVNLDVGVVPSGLPALAIAPLAAPLPPPKPVVQSLVL